MMRKKVTRNQLPEKKTLAPISEENEEPGKGFDLDEYCSQIKKLQTRLNENNTENTPDIIKKAIDCVNEWATFLQSELIEERQQMICARLNMMKFHLESYWLKDPSSALSSNSVMMIQVSLNSFDQPLMQAFKNKVPDLTAEERKLLAEIEAAIEKLRLKSVPYQKKSAAEYINDKMEALSATKEYLYTKDIVALTKALEAHQKFDKAAFGRSNAKRLIQKACIIKKHTFPDPKLNKKSKFSALVSKVLKPRPGAR